MANESKAPARRPGGAAAGSGLLFLREEEMRQAQELMGLAWRDFGAVVDPVLEGLGLGRAHHRVLQLVGHHPGIAVGALLDLLGITKQSLGRVLADLQSRGYVTQEVGRRDRRLRLLHLTESGAAVERQLFDLQREKLMGVYRDAGAAAIEGFRRVMQGLMDDRTRRVLDSVNAATERTRRGRT
ncbi:transcriptional regulator, MarR family [Gluconacetobacter diazotrophicus PA1 5]|uniref:MarR family transcriptional regulator n=2 Tax=Gluconacetobacter diazotrophicus TaxID=33996 RepID=A0A7W4I6G8_GLUDI|nr:MarR family transcriptional regulator [Gluconacetobacter diazotrophicus]ACI53013.1 transcriptional regulator, MarR family [Gluconacetobacter diazotrophicus PA1 5]MBB2157156.1 MarR family transcriptional regulator [Gluconacetobacter diazotrophicus]TWB07684.1 DNA-binding MarR family transcriptional regulator [Gluconacetobacter diazotrophicus]CAP57024.1 putative transcriptional regulator, MarR family [Gluconacetobacter diazotrophicus PA1 5]